MNITSILSALDYDMSKIEFEQHDNLIQFRLIDFDCNGEFDKITSEIQFMYCANEYTETSSFMDAEYDEWILDQIYISLGKEPMATIFTEFDVEVLKVIDNKAAELDLTRNSYINKVLMEFMENFDE